jgi:hypothetical protein
MDIPEETTSADAETNAELTTEPTVAIFAAGDAVTAEVVRGMLEAEGITALIGEQVTSAYGGAFAVGEGFWGEIRVPASQEEAARALLSGYDAGDSSAGDTEELTRAAESSFDPEV